MTTTTARTRTASDSLLRFAIRLDGVVVALLGVVMIATAGPASSFTGLPTTVEYWAGALSVAYLPLAFALAARKQVRATGVWVAAINLGTTVALVALVLTGLAPLTTAGVVLALAVGVYTALIGDLQYLGVRRLRA